MRAIWPISMRISLGIIAIYVATQAFVAAEQFFLPIGFGILLAGFYLPFVRWLERKKIPTGVALLFCVLLTVAGLGVTGYFFSTQSVNISKDLPAIQSNLMQRWEIWQQFFLEQFGVNQSEQIEFLNQKLSLFLEHATKYVGSTLLAATHILSVVVLVIIYALLLIQYRRLVYAVIVQVITRNFGLDIHEAIQQIVQMIQQYVIGIGIIILIMSILCSFGLWIVGAPHALFLGTLAATLNIIPYVGIISVGLLSAAFTFITNNSFVDAGLVLLIFWVIHMFESNFLTPKIVGRKVQLNALASILAIVIGGHLWGIVGMILAIPYMAIFKIVCQFIPSLHFIAVLLGHGELHKNTLINDEELK
ncbi:MAG: AI-2E family transporter [Bacteroidia bacterium]|nr:AI-2E family transporter [Bacteroidia bacterium]